MSTIFPFIWILDEAIDSRLDFQAIRSEPLGPVVH